MEIVAMGLGDWIDRYELQAIASDSYTTNLIMVDRFSELPNFVNSMKSMLCNGRTYPDFRRAMFNGQYFRCQRVL